jgi:tetratricopeptide (TPR) repeat protein
MEKGNIPDAINHYSALIDHAPEFAEGWNARATAWFVADRYGLSMSDIRQTLILEPRHFGAMAGLGMILERMDRPEDALTIYLEAEKVHPNRPDVKAAIERLSAKVEGVKL